MAEEQPPPPAFIVRVFDPEKDSHAADAVEHACEVGPSGKTSLFTHNLGDPLCRVRNSPSFLMLVAETLYPTKLIIGVIRGCIKTATCGKKPHRVDGGTCPIYTKLAYVLGLRVAPAHRRMGVALELVARMEEWFRANGAEYSYMATEKDNEASLRLFTSRCGYREFRTPTILVNPVHSHRRLPASSRHVTLLRLPVRDAELLYRRRLSTVEFFPRDIDAVLKNPLSLGTFLAVGGSGYVWPGPDKFLSDPPESWAVVSVWDSDRVFRLELRGVATWKKRFAKMTRLADRIFPFLKLPSVPDLFHPFGFYFLYGFGGEGERAPDLVRALCGHAHNMAGDGGCRLVAAEVAASEPLRSGIPHWKRLSCAEDLWCLKRLAEEYSDGEVGDWTKAPPGPSIFVDPREV
ncbi:putative N-acetyltransferase HLS1 [Iris pallida]|uniref:N-acetyltransferase HLS1 n=1 Tax=Iris pallida TaxID=29817 RepID=A0AAX6F5P3_IRIPA|nr:putative N-acetyltransferase HLS1 [Iris pallida]